MELPCIPTRMTGTAQDGTVASTESPYHVVFAVGYEQVALTLITRKCQVIGRAVAKSLLSQEKLLQELAFFCKHLNSVIDAITDIDKSIV